MVNAFTPDRDCTQVTLSIVSHGHGPLLPELLENIQTSVDVPYRLILTLNTPEDEQFLSAFRQMPIEVIRNSKARGFGENHNRAFLHCNDPVFVIINPDIRGVPFTLKPLMATLDDDQVGASGPQIINARGITQDNARHFPTIGSLLARKLGFESQNYLPERGTQVVDWLAGMLVAYKSSAYQTVGGFDPDYFMYVEDVDIAWRLRQAGFASVWVPQVRFIHEAQHASRRKLQHFVWHVQSMARFFYKRWKGDEPIT